MRLIILVMAFVVVFAAAGIAALSTWGTDEFFIDEGHLETT